MPILANSCIKCHANSKHEGGFSLEDRAAVLKGSDDGAVVVPGKSAESLLIRLVGGLEADRVMPAKGPRLTAEQIGILRAWIDQGLTWEAGFHVSPFARRAVAPAASSFAGNGRRNRIVQPNRSAAGSLFFSQSHRGRRMPELVDDRTYIRRVYLDLVGLLPEPDEVSKFVCRHRRRQANQARRGALGR